ncbi:hypothetical protein BAUCODRAFT_80627 [Baudoinia panamericana UAMH 10762]|uniref:C2H2-type domain-containing protein n=1 Tax=Baudoinia panamericana (strain UAMH 10762) TaxID=717646 RepID=M2MYF4_BAUPA|nr:uncharacterized protein BAUCODRAFT_80627 [Baudoinia panamericana UAMH 10762]EMC91330.1 hypothetical protein BAUCODRAFT_80627 [Baudoinia panamericana UAMH 10762]
MATTQRPTTPQIEPFPPLESAPRTPSSLPSGANIPTTNGGAENPDLLRPHSRNTPADISPKSGKLGYSPGTSPLPLTGQAAMAELKRQRQRQQKDTLESRQTSPNPVVGAMHALMGGGGMSKPSDAPAPEKLSEPLRKAAEKINIPETTQGDSLQASPVSLGSFSSVMGSTGAPSAMTATTTDATSGPQYVAEPAHMTESEPYGNDSHLTVASDQANKAFSYPGPPPQQSVQTPEGGPSRGMSYPGIQGSPKSPASNKRHKCPYCSTDFTRHHNLKSHLLTHSQEKPYVCQTCQARFRRLHDLKRHTKLHTGERPHTCDKCGRRFARGDALARHNKGPGGCAGRRSSLGGDDEFGDGEGMDGVEYTGEEEEEGADPQARRVSEPSRKRTHLEAPQDANREVYRQHSSTYPPIGVQRPHVMMTESPKPLSPGQPPEQHRLSVDAAASIQHRNRSPSLTTQFQQQHFGRGGGGRTPPQPLASFTSAAPGPVILPPPSGQPQPRSGLPSALQGGGPGPSALSHGQVPPATAGSNPGSLSSHGRSSGSSMRDILATGGGLEQNDLWGYVRSLEQRFTRMQDEYELRISRLQEDVISLRGQLSASQAASYSSEMQGRY